MSSPQHFRKNILIPWTSVNATPPLLLWLSCLSCPLVNIRCSMLGSCVSEVSKSTLSCAMPSTSSGAQLLRTSMCWSSTSSSRKHGTFFTNFRVLTRTAEAALHVVWGERRDTFLLDPHAHARMDKASLGVLGWFPSCADWLSFFKMLYKMLFCCLSLLQWQLLSKYAILLVLRGLLRFVAESLMSFTLGDVHAWLRSLCYHPPKCQIV